MVRTNVNLALCCFKMSVKVMVSKKILASTANSYLCICWVGEIWWNYKTHDMGVKNQTSGGEISSKRVLCLEDKARKTKSRWR